MAPNDLTISGLLYEGSNFAEWKEKVQALVRMKGISSASPPIALDLGYGRREPSEHFQLVKSLTSKGLLDRLPPNAFYRTSYLMFSLERLATPFRLFDLPDQVRQEIYTYALVGSEYVDLRGGLGADPKTPYPRLLHVSAQVRKEALPIFYSRTHFSIDFSVLCVEPKHLRAWVKQIAGENSRHVRELRIYSWVGDIQIEYSDSAGLTVAFDDTELSNYVSEALKGKVEAHIATTEQCRRTLKLKGEAIFLALWSNEAVWKKWERAEEKAGGF